jgi:hypothetical protein
MCAGCCTLSVSHTRFSDAIVDKVAHFDTSVKEELGGEEIDIILVLCIVVYSEVH